MSFRKLEIGTKIVLINSSTTRVPLGSLGVIKSAKETASSFEYGVDWNSILFKDDRWSFAKLNPDHNPELWWKLIEEEAKPIDPRSLLTRINTLLIRIRQ